MVIFSLSFILKWARWKYQNWNCITSKTVFFVPRSIFRIDLCRPDLMCQTTLKSVGTNIRVFSHLTLALKYCGLHRHICKHTCTHKNTHTQNLDILKYIKYLITHNPLFGLCVIKYSSFALHHKETHYWTLCLCSANFCLTWLYPDKGPSVPLRTIYIKEVESESHIFTVSQEKYTFSKQHVPQSHLSCRKAVLLFQDKTEMKVVLWKGHIIGGKVP